jgi:hypothetical protein
MNRNNKLICRIKGGLGNQLFCYAAAKRLAIINRCELIIDYKTGFTRDYLFKRKYSLNNFNIKSKLATDSEMLYPYERVMRAIQKYKNKIRRYENRDYITEEINCFDDRLLNFKIKHPITYIDGLWQSEKYFSDINGMIRKDLQFKIDLDAQNTMAYNWIKYNNAICIHVRNYEVSSPAKNVNQRFYIKAIDYISKNIESPKFVLFSDNPDKAKGLLPLNYDDTIVIDWNKTDNGDLIDLHLMSKCKHHIIANSTFSWWGAWLGENDKQIVIYPIDNVETNWLWNYKEQMPHNWLPINNL